MEDDRIVGVLAFTIEQQREYIVDETTRRTRSYRTSLTPRHLLGLPVVLMLLLSLLGVASAQTPEASPAANATPGTTSTPGIALVSDVSPGTASGTDQIVLTQNVVVNGTAASWTIETPLTGKLTYRDATCDANGTQKTTCENTFDAGTSTVTTTGTLDTDASFGQARVRIVLAVQEGSQAADLEIVSNATSADAADSATAFLKILGAPAPAVIVTTPTTTTEATETPTEVATETPVPTEAATETPSASETDVPAATPATSDADTTAPGASEAIALVSSLSPATASGTDQVVLTQNVVIQGEGSSWTVTTPLTGDLLYRSVSCSPAGTQGTSCENTFDAVTNSVITTGTLEDGASFGQARIRIVTAVEGGNHPEKIAVDSNATAGDASDDATAFLDVIGPENTIVTTGSQASTTTEVDVTPETEAAADTPTESASTPVPAGEATADVAPTESSPATTEPATAAPAVETATEPEAATSDEPTAEGAHEGEGETAEGEEEDTDNTTTILIIVGIVAVIGIGSALGILKNLRDGGPTSTKK